MLVPPLLVPPLLVPPLLVPSVLVPPLLRFQALVPMVQRLLFCGLPSGVSSSPAGYKKAPDFTRSGHRIVQSTLLLSLFCITGGIHARTFIRRIHHNEVEQDTF